MKTRVLDLGNSKVESGFTQIFSHLKNKGPMYTGSGVREVSKRVSFSSKFKKEPLVQASIATLDTDKNFNCRYSLTVSNINDDSFTVTMKTWGDTKIAFAK